MLNPFLEDTYPVDYSQSEVIASVSGIHDKVLGSLCAHVADVAASGLGERIAAGHGATVLLLSPQAGLGKTHLLHRMAVEVADRAIVVPVRFSLDEPACWRSLFGQTLARLAETDVSACDGGLTFAQEIARHVFSEVTALLIEEGEVPSANPQNAISGLRRNYLQLFDAGGENAAVRDWLTNNFEQLRPVMANVLAERRNVVESAALFWLEIFRAVNDVPRGAACADALAAACPPEGDSMAIQSISKLRMSNLCRIASIGRPLVFIVDHLDSFFGHPQRGRDVAFLLEELRLLSPGQMTVVAMNRDLWDSAFGEHLPEALRDRMTAHALSLGLVRKSEAEDVLRERGRAAGIDAAEMDELLRRLELPPAEGLSPRVALRMAAKLWGRKNGIRSGASVAAADAAIEKESLGRVGEIRPIPPKTSVPLKSLLFDEDSQLGPDKVNPSEIKKKGNILAMVERLKKRRLESEATSDTPGDLNGTGKATRRESNGAVVPIALRQRPGGKAPHPLLERFHRLRDELSSSDLRQESLRSLVRAVGEQSLIVDFSESAMPHRKGASLARWSFPDSEVFFCFASGGDTDVWDELMKAGAEKVRLARLDEIADVKLVAFAAAGTPPSPAGVDRIEFGAMQAVTLEAAARLLEDPSSNGAEVLGLLSEDLGFFWKRVTRTVRVAAV